MFYLKVKTDIYNPKISIPAFLWVLGFLIILLPNDLSAQRFEWVATYGSFNFDQGRSLTLDSSGNVYLTGYFGSTTDFDPGPGIQNFNTNGSHDVFVQKLDSAGNMLWTRTFGGNFSDQAFAIAVDSLGNVYTAGYFQDTVDFDPGSAVFNAGAGGGGDMFIQKMDSAGNFLWVKTFQAPQGQTARSIATDRAGDIYITGDFSGSVDFDPGPGTFTLISNGNPGSFILKLDAQGNFIWARATTGNDHCRAKGIAIDGQFNVYTTGLFFGTADFDPGPGVFNRSAANGISHVYIQKLDQNGNFLWAKTFGGAQLQWSEGTAICVGPSGTVHSTGFFTGTVDMDPGPGTSFLSSSGDRDVFVHTLNANGNFVWAKSFGGNSGDMANSITADPQGDVYTTGRFQDTVDFDPGLTSTYAISNGAYDVFVQKLDANGRFQWVRSFGGSATDIGTSIGVSPTDKIYTAGFFNGTVDFDPGPALSSHNSRGQMDIFLQMMAECQPQSSTEVRVACDRFTWIDSITYTASTDSAFVTLTDINGCDSVVFLDLTLNAVTDIGTSLNGASLTANNANATYQWLDCNNNYAPIPGAINQTFTATAIGSYSVELTENGCVDTSECTTINQIGLPDLSLGEGFSVYPIPSDNKVNIDFNQQQEYLEVEIYSLQGHVLIKQEYRKVKSLELLLPNYKGVFVLNLRTSYGQSKVKLIRD